MGEIGSGNNSSYPGALDTNAIPEVNSPAAGKTKARKEVVEDLTDGLIKVETELGTDPAGSLADVKTFLQTQHQTDGTHKNTHGPHKWLDEQDYSNFTTAVAAAANKTLVVARSMNLDANTTIPASVSLMPLNPGIINANGYTLTINGPVVGNPMHQWLIGFAAGEVTLNNYGNPSVIHPVWFGMKGDNGTTGSVNNAAWAVCIASVMSANAYPTIEFEPNGRYLWTGTMTIDRPCIIRWNRAKLYCAGDAGQSNSAVKITAASVTIYDGPIVESGNLSTNQATNGIGIYILDVGGTRLHGPDVSEFTHGIRIVGSTASVQDTAIYDPVIANCVNLFTVGAGAGGSVNDLNVYGGYLLNDNLVAYGITNARCVDLDGTGGLSNTDGIKFINTIIQSANINGGTKLQLTQINDSSFTDIYWDSSSVVSTGKDIRIESDCNNISIRGGASLGAQKIENNCASLTIIDPTKGMVLSGGRRLADSGGATDEHAGYMQKWILQNDTLGDDITKNLPDATAGILFIHAGVEGGMLLIKADGTVTIVNGTANLVATDTDTKLCVYQSSTRAIIKNRLGSSVSIRAEYTYL